MKHEYDENCTCVACFRADTYVCPRTSWGAPLTDEPEQTSLFGEVLDGLWTLFALIGMITAICMVAGYVWYRSTP